VHSRLAGAQKLLFPAGRSAAAWRLTFLSLRQNRVNPATLAIIPAATTGVGEYWLSPDDTDVRPYGFLIRRPPSPKTSP
jgi:hypothetical protein